MQEERDIKWKTDGKGYGGRREQSFAQRRSRNRSRGNGRVRNRQEAMRSHATAVAARYWTCILSRKAIIRAGDKRKTIITNKQAFKLESAWW